MRAQSVLNFSSNVVNQATTSFNLSCIASTLIRKMHGLVKSAGPARLPSSLTAIEGISKLKGCCGCSTKVMHVACAPAPALGRPRLGFATCDLLSASFSCISFNASLTALVKRVVALFAMPIKSVYADLKGFIETFIAEIWSLEMTPSMSFSLDSNQLKTLRFL